MRKAMEILEEQLTELDRLYLIPTPERVQHAKTVSATLVQALHESDAWMFDVAETLRHGSLSRGTGLRTFDDFDVLVILNAGALRTRDGQERSAEDTIRRMAWTLIEVFDANIRRRKWMIREQTHSVGVELRDDGFRVDLVPAIRDVGQFRIPSRSKGSWITTYPVEAERRMDSIASEKRWVKRAVRLMKGWRCRAEVPIASYALETLVLDRASHSDKLLAGLIYGIFKELDEAHAGRRLDLVGTRSIRSPVRVIDPFSGANITEGLDARDRMQLIAAGRAALQTLQDMLKRWNSRAPRGLDPALVTLFMPR